MRLPVMPCTTRRLFAGLLSAFIVFIALPAHAQIEVPRDWPLKPAGLDAGDEFRLLFMGQNGLQATSTDIATYDAFVQGIITRKGHADITAYAANFKVLGSTSTVNARTHTGTTGSGGVPIYWLNGPKVADNYGDFYDGSWSNRNAAVLQDGVMISQNRRDQFLCTGTNDDGTTAQPLGADPCTATTFDTTTNTLSGKTLATSAKARYLALSDVFKVEELTGAPPPVVERVQITSNPGSDREYVAGDTIEVAVTFSEPVAVTGTPRLKLTLDTQKNADYIAAESTATRLVFSYTVQAADYAHVGASLPGDGLELNGGTIKNQAGTVDADLDYTGMGPQSRHSVYILPTVSGVAVVSTPVAYGIYATGETIKIDLTWDRKITVFGAPRLAFIIGSSPRQADYTTTTGDHVTRFEYEVEDGDSDANGISLMNNAVRWNGGHIIRQGHGDHADKASVNVKLYGGGTSLPALPHHRVNVSPSTDATLDLLVLFDGHGEEIAPTPEFDVATKSYSASVSAGVNQISINAVGSGFPHATVEFLDSNDAMLVDADTNERFFQVPLSVGANTIKVKVTANDGVTSETYVVAVTRTTPAPNNPATGKPSITGTAQAGRTLTAAKGTITDSDGMTRADSGDAGYAYTYQWIRVDGSDNETEVGENASTYTLVAADVGHSIKVKAWFTDDADNAEGPLASDTTETVAAPASTDATLSALTLEDGDGNAVALDPDFDAERTSYTARVDNPVDQITVSSEVSDDGATAAYRDGGDNAIADADTNAEGQQVALAVGVNTIKVKVTAEDGVTIETYTVEVTRAAGNTVATGKPAVTGTAQAGQTLTASIDDIVDPDGVPGTVGYQWVRVDADGSSNPTNIGTNSSAYTLVAADVGKRVRVEVSFTDDRGTAEGPLVSDAVPKAGTVAAAGAAACPADADWCTEVTLSYASSSISNALFNERWGYGNDTTPGAIDDDTFSHGGTEYTVKRLELNRLTISGSGVNDVLTLVVASGELPDSSVLALDGTELTIDETSATQNTGQEQWSVGPPGLPFNWGQNQKVTLSLKLPPVGPARGAPAITGAPQVGETLTASIDNIEDADGVPGTVDYQWVRVDAEGLSNPTNIGTNSSTYTPAAADVGKKLRVEVSFTDNAGNAEGPLASDAVPGAGTVAGAKPACPVDSDWCTEMTLFYLSDDIDEDTLNERLGYSSLFTPGGAIGDDTFSYGGREYTIERLEISRLTLTGGGVSDLLTFELITREPPDGTVLSLDDAEFLVDPESDTHEHGKEQWNSSETGILLGWVEGQKVTVSLTFPSSGTTLSALTVSDSDGNAVALTPGFAPEKTTYTANVGNAVQQVAMAPELFADGATIEYLDGSDNAIADADTNAEGHQVALVVGANIIKMKVTAEDHTTRTYTVTVRRAAGGLTPAPESLTGSFVSVPASHDGTTPFELQLEFSEETPLSYRTLRDNALEVSGGAVTGARRVTRGSNLGWWITVAPAGAEAVSVTLPARACTETGAVCTADDRALSSPVTATVQGPPRLSVADAQVTEAAGAVLAFAVTLDRAASSAVTVDYATSDGTATAGSDYTAVSDTLTFAVGEREKTVSVAVHDDSHDEGDETLTLTLSNASGAWIEDGEATGTISNSDHVPRAWLARFGRTVADQVLDAVEGRMMALPAAEATLTVAGHQVGGGAALPTGALEAEAGLESLAEWLGGESQEDWPALKAQGLTARDLLVGTSFGLSGGSSEGGFGALWGRGALTRFDGREGELTLDGEVASALFGADLSRRQVTAGLVVGHSRGAGDYHGPSGDGAVESVLTGLYPWGRYALSERFSLWGVAGIGAGTLRLTPEAQAAMEADLALALGAVGARGVLVEAPGGRGVELAAKSDALLVRTSSDEVREGGMSLAASQADVTRLRFGLEGTWRGFGTPGGGRLVPTVEFGVRHDDGDAETGFGADVGVGLTWTDPVRGIRVELRGRGLLTHESGGFRERGFAGSLAWDPDPSAGVGPSLTVRQTLGASASGGMDALLSPQTARALGTDYEVARSALDVKFGYGFPLFGGGWTGTPELGLRLSDSHRETILGWRLGESRPQGLVFGLDVEGARRESAAGDAAPVHRLGFRMTARW